MAWTTQLKGYVKFLRGTPAAYEASDKNADTLYFVSETNASKGKLYLGTKLISGDEESSNITNLADLQDVLINAGITSNNILVYNSSTLKWESTPIQTVLSSIVTAMTGATETTDGTGGLVPKPVAGQQNLFLRGDGTWASPSSDLQAQINAIRGSDATGSIRDIAASEVVKLVNGAPDALDTLGEIAEWITDHDATIDIVQTTNRLGRLEKTVYGNSTTEGLTTTVSNLNTIINGGNGVVGLTSTVSTLQTKVSTMESNLSDLTNTVTDLSDKLRWQDLVEIV